MLNQIPDTADSFYASGRMFLFCEALSFYVEFMVPVLDSAQYAKIRKEADRQLSLSKQKQLLKGARVCCTHSASPKALLSQKYVGRSRWN